MKRNRMLLAGLFTFALVCVSLTFVGSTYAKYTSEVTGSDTIRAAKYQWTFNGADEENLLATTFDLDFAPTLDSDVVIAPDFKFSKEFVIENAGETTLVFTISQKFNFVTTSGASNPVLLSATLNSTNAYTASTDLHTDFEALDDTFELAPGESATFAVTFAWPAGSNSIDDANDTLIGRDDSAKWTYALKVLAVQKVGSDTVIE